MEIANYRIEYLPGVILHDIPKLGASAKILVKRAIETRLQNDPLHYGKSLGRSLHGLRRLRVSDYRILYKVEEKKRLVTITAIGHRRDIYKRFGH